MVGVATGVDEQAWWTGDQARVFISCGQRGELERRVAHAVRAAVRRSGFCPYLAFEVHSSAALTNGIYDHLRTAEYFLFIDFARDRLGRSRQWRGSLFSNQELAIASYIGLDCLFFVERSIRPRDGILGAIQGNPVPFERRDILARLVRRKMAEAAWDPEARLELRVEPFPAVPSDAVIGKDKAGGPVVASYWQFRIRNTHPRMMASDCRIQLTWLRGPTGTLSVDPLEVKFAGVTWPTVSVPALSVREFDALIVLHAKPDHAILGILNPGYVDSERTITEHSVDGPGDYEADLRLISREFRPAHGTLTFHLGACLEDVKVGWKPARESVVGALRVG